MASHDAVFQNVRFSRSQDNAKHLLGEQTVSVIVTDQCASYNWLDPTRHQFCLAHVKRNLQQMADYSGGGLTARLGAKLVLMVGCIFRTQHRFEQDEISEPPMVTPDATIAAKYQRIITKRDAGSSQSLCRQVSAYSQI